MTAEAKFKVGDKVRIAGPNGSRTVWTVGAEDTNQTPVHDPEPAYRLDGPRYYRYAYESDLQAAS